MKKPANNDYPILDVLEQRWSARAYDPDRLVEREKLLSIFEAARWTPSSMNLQPWRFIVATRDNPAAFDKLLSIINEKNQRWAKNAPVLWLGMTLAQVRGREHKNARHDLGEAVANMTAQATAFGLSIRQMGGILPEKAREIYNIPAEYEILNAAALGYAAPPETLPEDLAVRERAERQRHPLSTFVFDEWGQPSALLSEARETASL